MSDDTKKTTETPTPKRGEVFCTDPQHTVLHPQGGPETCRDCDMPWRPARKPPRSVQVSRAHWDRVTRDIQDMLDRDERTALSCVPGGLQALGVVAQLEGFADWPDVERCARDHGHRVAIELLCRHRQRSAS